MEVLLVSPRGAGQEEHIMISVAPEFAPEIPVSVMLIEGDKIEALVFAEGAAELTGFILVPLIKSHSALITP